MWPSNSDPVDRFRNINMLELRRYMHWYLDTHPTLTMLSSLYVRMRFWRMAFARTLYKPLDYLLASEMRSVTFEPHLAPLPI